MTTMKPDEQALLHIRPARQADTDAIWHILKGEIEVMRLAGRDQWQYGYPNPEVVAADIAHAHGWVLIQGERIVGYCAMITSGDPAYDHIWDGQWLTSSHSANARYAVVHRIGIDPLLTGRGLATALMHRVMAEAAQRGCESMRIDTNHDNAQMLHLLPKLGFTACGKVRVHDGERLAFEKIL